MVFSLFKKTQEKMPERQVARPKPQSVLPGEESQPAASSPAPSVPAPAPAQAPAGADLPELDFTDSQFDQAFSESMSIAVEQDLDPVQADIEQAAVLFANGQDAAARSVLEASARANGGANAIRLWHMLLDLMQVIGDRPGFEKLGMEFAQACETSPPTWRETEKLMPAAESAETVVVMQGVIAGSDVPEISRLKAALASKGPLRLDLGKLASCDNEAAGAICELLRLARKQGVPVSLDGAEGLVGRLENRLQVGVPETPSAWLLLLELYQRLGQQALFEEKAVDYAVTFEVSPPSWETANTSAKTAKSPSAAAAPVDGALFLAGELKNYRFGELPQYLETRDQPVIDFSRVKRLDFFSAGILRNSLEPFQRRGKEIVIRHPNHLVAELLRIVGLDSVARIILPKS